MNRVMIVTALLGAAIFGLAACGGSGSSQPVSQSGEAMSQVSAGPPESAIQVLQDDGFPPAAIALPLPPNGVGIAESPADINNENNPQELVVVFNSPSAAGSAATNQREALVNAGYTAVVVSIKADGYAVVLRGSTSDFLKLGLG
jgi:hypothetical protein